MAVQSYQKGESAVVMEPPNPAGRHGSREPSFHHVEVAKSGRCWITVKSASGRRWKFDTETLECGDDFYGPSPELWKSIADAQASWDRGQAWDRLKAVMRSMSEVPDHLTAAQIEVIIEILKEP